MNITFMTIHGRLHQNYGYIASALNCYLVVMMICLIRLTWIGSQLNNDQQPCICVEWTSEVRQ